jgi:amino acid adenylation domain-containing protein
MNNGMNIYHFFENSCKTHPEREALYVEGESYSYKELQSQVSGLTHRLKDSPGKRVGIFAARSVTAYAGLLGALKCGKAYVPLNLKFQGNRNRQIAELAELDTFVVDEKSIPAVLKLGKDLGKSLTLLVPELSREQVPDELISAHTVFASGDLSEEESGITDVHPDTIAYVLFTSGSTGVPKGVPVSHGNVNAYVTYQKERYDFTPEDRFSQSFDLTFDPSVHDIFMCFQSGAALYTIPEGDVMAPAKFINEHDLTIWYSVPSVAQFMHRFRMLKKDRFPKLRWSIFSGEALPVSIAASWQEAAPNAQLENLYGPTEATINITHYLLPKEAGKVEEVNGIVSIGDTFHNQHYSLIDEQDEVTEGEGELCVSGSLVTKGYLNNPEKTRQQYIQIRGREGTWYRTGDLVREKNGLLYYITRTDFQVKIRGYRVELDEVSLAISEITGASVVCSLPYPVQNGVAESIYSFVDREHRADKTELLRQLSERLPEYMVPKEILFIERVPLNPNGKIDRKQLLELIK